VFVDDAGANLAMGRSHAWVKRRAEYVEPRPITSTLGDSNRLLLIWRLGSLPLKLLPAYSQSPSHLINGSEEGLHSRLGEKHDGVRRRIPIG
jgi:hypothetical protein